MKIVILSLLMLQVVLLAGCGQDPREDPLLRQAHARQGEGDKDGALDVLNRALMRRPDLAEAHLDAALLYDEHRRDYVRAIYHYNRYLELRPRVEKREMIEDLIRRAKMSFAAEMTEQGAGRDQRIRQLQEENERLRNDLRDLRANLARQRLEPAAAVSAPPAGRSAAAPPAVAPPPAISPAPSAAPPVSGDFNVYHVQPRDTLSTIAAQFYQDPRKWQVIFEANRDRLSSPERLNVGQTLLIPVDP